MRSRLALAVLALSVVLLAGCSGSGGLSDTERTYCDHWFGNVIYAGMTLNNLPQLPWNTADGTSPDWNMLATWASMSGGSGQYGAMYGQQISQAETAWKAGQPDSYAQACKEAVRHYAPKQ